MSDDDPDLFDDQISLEDLNQAVATNYHSDDNWEQTLIDVLDAGYRFFSNNGHNEKQATQLAVDLAKMLGELLGGQQLYYPKGIKLETALRDRGIWKDSRHIDLTGLAKKYKLSERHIYNICARQQALHIKKIQPDLFPAESE